MKILSILLLVVFFSGCTNKGKFVAGDCLFNNSDSTTKYYKISGINDGSYSAFSYSPKFDTVVFSGLPQEYDFKLFDENKQILKINCDDVK